jgi:hypothetical protein
VRCSRLKFHLVSDNCWGSVSELTSKIGRSSGYITKRIALLNFTVDVLEAIKDSSLNPSSAGLPVPNAGPDQTVNQNTAVKLCIASLMELLDDIVIRGLLISWRIGTLSKSGSSDPNIRTMSLSVIIPTGFLLSEVYEPVYNAGSKKSMTISVLKVDFILG